MMSNNKNNKSIFFITIFFSLLLGTQIQAQNKGFSPPGSNFGNNPFAGKAGAPPAIDPDELEDEDEEDISEELIRNRTETKMQTGKGRSSGQPVDINSVSNEIGATTMQGGVNAKILTGSKGQACLTLDPNTGYGPDIVTNFDFPDADIVEIAKTLGRLTCHNFMFDKDVRGKISIVSNAPITIGDAWKAFLTSLDTNGFSLIPSGKYFRIARQRDAKDKQIKTYVGDSAPDNDMYITRVIPLKYINAEEVSRVFRNFMPPNTRIISYDQTNTLIITDTGSNIKKITDMLYVLDVETFDEKLEVVKIRFASAQEIAKLIDQLLPNTTGGGAGGVAGGGMPRFRGGQARRTKEGGVISNIIPDDRTNSVIISANGRGLEQVKELIDKLDAKVTQSTAGSRIQVVYLQFADAEQVANTLNSLATGSSGASRPSGQITPGGTASPAPIFEGSIKISPDKATNSLVITGSPSDYQTMLRVIQKLDVPRDQVYVEAFIMEMIVDKTFELGTSIANPTNGIGFMPNSDLASFLVNPLSVNGLVMGFQGGSGSKTFTVPGSSQSISVKSIQGLIKALQLNSNANILSTPQILTLDNQEATIEVAEMIPVPTFNAISGGGGSTSVSREKIALSLKIKPQINKASDFVKLDIDQKFEDISNRTPPKAVADLAFGTQSRASKTTVVVQDGDTVALGGLVRDKVTETATKIPLLGDIPILGWLFRSKTTQTQKQNLISFITPKIIKQYQNVRKILDEVEDAAAVGEGIDEGLAEADEAGPVEQGGAEDPRLGRAADGIEVAERAAVERLVKRHHGGLGVGSGIARAGAGRWGHGRRRRAVAELSGDDHVARALSDQAGAADRSGRRRPGR